jgi:hypothetical protein
MSNLLRSAGLAPVAGTIDWLTHIRCDPGAPGLRRARPGGKRDSFGSRGGAIQSCARPGQARHGARCLVMNVV